MGLSLDEAARRREAVAHLLLQLNNKRSLLTQKAWIRWLKDGDVNNRTFHKAINKRRLTNRLMGLEIGGEWREEPIMVKGAIKIIYRNLFLKREANLIELPSNLFESRLDIADGDFLTRRFSDEEIKQAIWDF